MLAVGLNHLFTLLSACLAVANAVPNVAIIGSNIRIFLNNDLSGNQSTQNTAVLISDKPETWQNAKSTCQAFGEDLWIPADSLEYDSRLPRRLFHNDQSHDIPEFWVSSNLSKSCNAISASGAVPQVDCRIHLPAICTQSAPYSTYTTTDNSLRWQIGINTGSQQITGYRDKLSFRFLGVRYAQQPERFTYSSPFSDSGNFTALSTGSECIQSGCNSTTCSEDCLFMNIWTPFLPFNTSTSSDLKPVMLWIHGGAFTSGTGSDPTFDGGNMASRGDVVVVTINYRLSTLGFLALDDGITNGNFGLADQITALDWLHQHISSFGGDPSRITIFGQSAGAASVRALLASPKAIGKFAGAIMQSNLAGLSYGTTYSSYYTIPEVLTVATDPILQDSGCANASSPLACLRAYDPYALVALPDVSRYLVVDGTYLTTPSLPLTGAGPAAHVPVLMGVMRDDAAAFTTYPSNGSFPAALSANAFSPSLLSSNAFPAPTGSNATLNAFNLTARIATDAELRCLDLATAAAAAKHNVFPRTYFYQFDRSYQLRTYSPNFPVCEAPPTAGHPYGDPGREYFRCHSGELYYVFGTLAFNGLPERDGRDAAFSRDVVDAWAGFAWTGVPGGKGVGVDGGGPWVEVQAEEPVMRVLDWPVERNVRFGEREQCEVLGLPLTYYDS